MNKTIRCYNCGKELNKGDETREHIPAKTLFEGYDKKYKEKRIIVPACFECNNKYSLTDEEFRNLVGVIAKRKENHPITDKAIRSILRKDSSFSRLQFNQFGQVSNVEFCEQQIKEFHIKNFKGLFYYQYGYPLPKNYELYVNIDEEDYSEPTLSIIRYLEEFFESKYSGHPDILSYCIQPLRLDIQKSDRSNLELRKGEDIIVGILSYNREHAALVYAIKKEFLEKIKTKLENEKLA